MLIKYLISLYLAVTSLASFGHENNLIERESQVEVVYMFSYACPTCRLLSPYMSAWDRAFPEVTRLPAFSDVGTGDHWRSAARRYFVLHALNREKLINLSRSDIDKLGFSIQDEPVKPGVEKMADVDAFLKSWGLTVSQKDLEGAWVLSDMYMQDSEAMIARIRKELGRVATPVIRISSPIGVEYVSIQPESEDPPMDFLTKASETIKKHKRAVGGNGKG